MQLCVEIARFLTVFEETQLALLQIFQQKRGALIAADADALDRFNAAEQAVTNRLQALITWRERLLSSGRASGAVGETLAEVLQSLRDPQAAGLLEQVARLQGVAVELRQEAWVQWIISNRFSRHYGEMVDLIAQGGRPAATYSERPSQQTLGAAILDAAV